MTEKDKAHPQYPRLEYFQTAYSKERNYNENIEEVRRKTGTSNQQERDIEDAGDDYGLIKGSSLTFRNGITSINNVNTTDEPRHTAMRALIATVVASGCSCSRCERLRDFVPEIGRRTLAAESAKFQETDIKHRTSQKKNNLIQRNKKNPNRVAKLKKNNDNSVYNNNEDSTQNDME